MFSNLINFLTIHQDISIPILRMGLQICAFGAGWSLANIINGGNDNE
ncbi:MAG: hypothetical protein ACI4PE_02760 [Bacilli bacterium]